MPTDFEVSEVFLPYHEPDIITILVQSSFLLALNVVNSLIDKLLFCGLLGQVFVGVAWGTPGARWLGLDVEDSVVQLGYLGLILLVYEGGLDTNFSSLKANLFLSVAVAITGISFPIALSFVLLPLVGATPIQAFAAGAALCSTSLGTTFTILSTTGLSATRLGTVLTTAAMLDDVVGLVMVEVISNLGDAASFNAVTVVRPLAVSAGFALATPIFCRYVASPMTGWLYAVRKASPRSATSWMCRQSYTPFVLHTITLLGFVIASTYAGTSNLFAAYLAGASISWWDSEIQHPSPSIIGATSPTVEEAETPQIRDTQLTTSQVPINAMHIDSEESSMSSQLEVGTLPGPELNQVHQVRDKTKEARDIGRCGIAVYHAYYGQAVQRILKPFFFASIGFAIPVTEMFSGAIFWRSVVYTVLMLCGKAVTGLWLVRMEMPRLIAKGMIALRSISLNSFCKTMVRQEPSSKFDAHEMQEGMKPPRKRMRIPPAGHGKADGNVAPIPNIDSSSLGSEGPPAVSKEINKPLSLYPAAMLGTAMTARGEIGFLIASLAETTGLFAASDTSKDLTGSSEIYLIVTWAIVLCTIIGPPSVGLLTKRVRRLQSEREKSPGKAKPLGIWGIS